MNRIITLLLAVLMTPAVIVFLSPEAKAQHAPGYVACDGKYIQAYGYGNPAGYKQFMDNCLSSIPAATVPPTTTAPAAPTGTPNKFQGANFITFRPKPNAAMDQVPTATQPATRSGPYANFDPDIVARANDLVRAGALRYTHEVAGWITRQQEIRDQNKAALERVENQHIHYGVEWQNR